ncbi:6447_t:CDS:2 [Funneliformis geosporum]|uniref:6447_t:CDS:1 n=1 Tax=Funneliformis geosporum TaxID=1117311 RepID=A0A9W4WVG9_9GLOM|nr:6447_t:CDS:2 [Funneliformis geosporum]
MKHLAAYLLLELAGKTPNDKSIKSLLESVGIEADNDRLKKLLNELKEKNTEEVSPPAEETKEEEKEESDDDMGFGLFD